MKVKTVKIVLIILLSILCMNLEAQTVIREKVKIKDSKAKDLINFSQLENVNWWPCTPPPKSTDYYNPHQVVWQGSVFPLNPGLQDLRSDYSYGINKNKMYTIRILSGSSYCYFQRNKWSPDYGEPEIIRNEITLPGRDMFAKTMTDTGLAVIDYCERVLDRDGAPFYAFTYWFEYTLHFGYIGQSEVEVIYSIQAQGDTSVYVHSYIKKPSFDLTYSVGKDTILYREKNEITIGASSVECFNTASYMIPRNGGSIADDVSCTFRILQGAEYCNIKCSDPFIAGDEITIPFGVAKNGIALFTNDDLNPAHDEEIILEYTCQEPSVRNRVVYISFVIKHNPYPPPGILFVFDKNHIAKGDSTYFTLKRRTVDGQIVDFSNDQKFNISVYDGADYGSLYSIEHDSYNNSMEEVPNGFKFYSYPDIEAESAAVTFRASTMISTSSPSVIANKAREMKVPAGLNLLFIGGGEELIEGYGTLTIGETPDTFYVKASFDKENFSAGDILNVGFVKVDKKGNVSSFPEGTLYEVRVDEGCTVGELLIAGGRGSYFKDVSMPIQFVVNDSLGVGDTLISVKVGVPNEEGTVYLNYTNASTGTAIAGVNYKIIGKAKSVTGSASACAGSSFVYTVNANAVAKAGGGKDCDEPKNQCTTNEEPKAPTFNFIHGTSYTEPCSIPPKTDKDGYLIYNIAGLLIRDNPIQTIRPQVCYNKSSDRWVAKINDANRLDITFDSYYCEQNMVAQWPGLLVSENSIEQIPVDEICRAIEDICKQRRLNRGGTKYAVRDVIWQHEEKHLDDYKKAYEDCSKTFKLSSTLSKLSKSCEDINSKQNYTESATKEINNLFKDFKTKVHEYFMEKHGSYDEALEDEDEYKVQGAAFTKCEVRTKYLDRLVKKAEAAGKIDCLKILKKKFPGLIDWRQK